MTFKLATTGLLCALVAIYCVQGPERSTVVAKKPKLSYSSDSDRLDSTESDPEGSYSSVSRTKRDVEEGKSNLKLNSSMTTQISNTTMVQLLHNLINKNETQSMERVGPKAQFSNSGPDDNLDESESAVIRVTRASFDTIKPQDMSMGDLDSLRREETEDLMTAAGYDSKKYVLVKKKPKHKKIKMEVFEPKMKYKKIKMKIPVKKMKKKKVKGYLVKKEKHYH